jgi:hypothetical protein
VQAANRKNQLPAKIRGAYIHFSLPLLLLFSSVSAMKSFFATSEEVEEEMRGVSLLRRIGEGARWQRSR